MSESPAPLTGSVASQSTVVGAYPKRWSALGVLVVGLLVVILDNTILNVALKTIQEDLGASQNQLVWAINAYSLAFAALLFTWGVMGDRFGRKKILLIGLGLFGVASALCAFATSPGELIAFRALMGIGGASVMPISLSIITVIFPPQERGKAIGVWAAAVGGAVALGPVLGGLLLEHPNWFQWLTGNDWGSVFFINVPIVIIGGIGIFMLVPETKNPRPGKLDPIGLVLSVVGLFAVVYGIQNASTVGWVAPSTWGFIVLGLIVLLAFGMYELKSTHPSIDLSLFRIRSFSIPLTGVSLAFAAMQGTLLFLTFYYQIVRGWSPLQAGLLVLPFAVGQLLGAPRSAMMVHRFGARKVIPGGLVFALVGMLGFAFVSPDAPVWFLIVIGVIFGFGLGNTIAPSTTRMTLATPPERSGSGSAVQNTVRQVGAVFGVAILSSVVGTVYSNNMSPLLAGKGLPPEALAAATDSIGGTNEVADRLAETGTVPAPLIEQLRQAANDSFMPALHTAAFVSAGLLVIAIAVVLVWLPAKAEAVAWAGSHPGEDSSDEDGAAEGRVHFVDEEGNDLEHVGDIPLEHIPTGRHYAREGDRHHAGHGAPVGVVDAPGHPAARTNGGVAVDGDGHVTATYGARNRAMADAAAIDGSANGSADGPAASGAAAHLAAANGSTANGAAADRTSRGTTQASASSNALSLGRHAAPEDAAGGEADRPHHS
jgi:EmrB/QacA subfamily drug resistance transporter